MRRTLALASIALALALGAFGLCACWLEPSSLRVVPHTLALPAWPRACDGLRVAVLSDLHVGSPWVGPERVPEIAALANAQQPDLVLLAGDYVVAHDMPFATRVAPARALRGLAALRAPLGVFAALGNHDGWWGAGQVRVALAAAGVRVLEDQSVALQRGACRLAVVGVSDLWTGAHDVARAFSAVPAREPVLAVMHNPDTFALLPRGVTLAVAGHTHGGQVALPLLGRPVIPSQFGQRYAAGEIVEGDRHFFVTTGIGTSLFPVRFGVPPEIALLTLRSAAR